MIKRLRDYLERYLMDDASPLWLLIWRYLKTRWRGMVWHVRSEWLHINPFDSEDAMWYQDEDDEYEDYHGDNSDLAWYEAGHDSDDDYPALELGEWDFYDYGDDD